MYAHRRFYKLTKKQRDWGVKHHGLFMGKPSGDIYIDDKGEDKLLQRELILFPKDGDLKSGFTILISIVESYIFCKGQSALGITIRSKTKCSMFNQVR